MAEKDLIPLKKKGDSYSDAIRAKIKGSSSQRRKVAQRISHIKFMKPETLEKKAWMLIQDENLSAMEIQRLILEMLKKPLKKELRAKLIDTAIRAHTAFHGTKSKNVNVNVDAINLWEKMMGRAKKELENEQTTT